MTSAASALEARLSFRPCPTPGVRWIVLLDGIPIGTVRRAHYHGWDAFDLDDDGPIHGGTRKDAARHLAARHLEAAAA